MNELQLMRLSAAMDAVDAKITKCEAIILHTEDRFKDRYQAYRLHYVANLRGIYEDLMSELKTLKP